MEQEIDKVIIGVDPGTVVMGYSIVHIVKGKVQPVVLDVLKFNAKLDHYTRLSHIFEELSKVVELYKPDEMALEALLWQERTIDVKAWPRSRRMHGHSTFKENSGF